MKDAFGSAFMVYVFLGFVIIFIIFISLILKYGQAFKIKDRLVSIIEEYEGSEILFIPEIESYIDSSNYRLSVSNGDWDNVTSEVSDKRLCINNEFGYCLDVHSSNRGIYYTVYTFVNWEFPFFGINGIWTIKGETRVLTS